MICIQVANRLALINRIVHTFCETSTAIFYHCSRSSICVIPQSPFLFTGTLRENIDVLGVTVEDEDRLAEVIQLCKLGMLLIS